MTRQSASPVLAENVRSPMSPTSLILDTSSMRPCRTATARPKSSRPGLRGNWAARLPVRQDGFQQLDADIVTLQETILTGGADQAGPSRVVVIDQGAYSCSYTPECVEG